MKRTAMVGLLALAGWSAQAAESAREFPVASAGIEASFSSFSGNDTSDPTLNSRFIDDNAVGFKLFGQYRFNKWVGFEGAYHNITDFEDQQPNAAPPNKLKLNFSGFSAQGLFFVPMPSEDLGAFIKAGYYDFNDELSQNSGTTSSSSESGLVAGGGFTFDLGEHLGVRAEYEWFDANVGDLQSVSLGFIYYFGGEKAAPPVAMAPAPVVVVAAAPPPPPPPPPTDSDHDGVTDDIDACPGTPAGARVNAKGCEEQLILQGVTFENNSAKLTGNSTLTLDSVADILKQRPNFKVEVRGHTDSNGSDEHNQRLSQDRADAVMEYLVSRGVPAGKLTAVGYGESQPVASNDTADGRAQNRRVALEFTENN